MEPKVLIIDDDERLLSLLSRTLAHEGFRVHCMKSPPSIQRLESINPRAIVVDWNLDGCSGLEWVSTLRADPVLHNLPVLMLSGRNDENQRVMALRDGADDFLSKPAPLPELSARLRNLIRRSAPQRLRFVNPTTEIDVAAKRFVKNGSALKLSDKEWTLLGCLLQAPGPVSRERLATVIWGDESAHTGKRLDMLVMRLRKNVNGSEGRFQLIRTVRNGYLFEREST